MLQKPGFTFRSGVEEVADRWQVPGYARQPRAAVSGFPGGPCSVREVPGPW